jgi:hypothetical protein
MTLLGDCLNVLVCELNFQAGPHLRPCGGDCKPLAYQIAAPIGNQRPASYAVA